MLPQTKFLQIKDFWGNRNAPSIPKNSSLSADIESEIAQERIRQAQWGFNLLAGAVSLTALVCIVLFFIGHPIQNDYAAPRRFLVTITKLFMLLYRETNDRLDRLHNSTQKRSEPEKLDGEG